MNYRFNRMIEIRQLTFMAGPSIATWKKISERGSDILRTAAAQRDGEFVCW
jgi:hypothetical protein